MASSSGPSTKTGPKQDVAWKHCQKFREDGKVRIKCIYCQKVIRGGGITRFKEHLAGRQGNGVTCLKVPPDVRLLLQKILDQGQPALMNVQEQVNDDRFLDSETDSVLVNHFENPEQTPTSGKRKRTDLAWKHCEAFETGNRAHIKCNYCAKIFRGGGISRFKDHLAGRKPKGGAPICDRVPPDVRLLMQKCLKEFAEEQMGKKQKLMPEEARDVSPPSNDTDPATYGSDRLNTGFAASGLGDLVEPNLNMLPDQPEEMNNRDLDRIIIGQGRTTSGIGNGAEIKASASRIVENPVHVTMGRFFYDIGATLDALDSSYFKPFIDSIASVGSQAAAPSRHDLRGWILKKLVGEVKNDINQFKLTWGKTGCSILVEEWNSHSGRTILNFLVNCSGRTVFLKSVEASHLIYSADGLYELLKLVVEEVGAGQVLQVITNGEEHYSVAGKRLMDTFPSLYWAPCAGRCIDLILEDFEKIEWISAVIEQARSVTRFVYNHGSLLNLMRRFTFGSDIVQQGATRSATSFTTLKRMADFKLNLQSMLNSQEWIDCPYSKQLGGLAMADIVSNRSFWSSCILIIRLTSPLLRALDIVSSQKRAAMGYIFSGIYLAKETIKRELIKQEDYMTYWNIIDYRWAQRQHPPLHAAGFFLNPKFFYSIKGDVHNEIMSRMFDCIERLVPETEIQDKIIRELNLYKNAVGDLGRKLALRARESMLPAEWWSTYGGGCPNLASLAIRILGQTCSSIGFKQNHIPFEKAHEARNCLERQRLSDLVFVQYNLRLRNMADQKQNQVSGNPISFDDLAHVEDWIMQNELFLDDDGNLDWMSLIPYSTSLTSSANTMLETSIDGTEELGSGFDDVEIFEGLKNGKVSHNVE